MFSGHSTEVGSVVIEGEPPLDAFCRNELFDVLGNQRRRYVLCYLAIVDEPRPCRDIAEQVAAWENDSAREQITSSQYQSVYNSFYQTHFPQLEEAGLVEYDRSEGLVYPKEHLAELEPILQRRASRIRRLRRAAEERRPGRRWFDRRTTLAGGTVAIGAITGSLHLYSVQTILLASLALVAILATVAIGLVVR